MELKGLRNSLKLSNCTLARLKSEATRLAALYGVKWETCLALGEGD